MQQQQIELSNYQIGYSQTPHAISDTDPEGAIESVRITCRVSGRRIKRGGELLRENVRDFFHFY